MYELFIVKAYTTITHSYGKLFITLFHQLIYNKSAYQNEFLALTFQLMEYSISADLMLSYFNTINEKMVPNLSQ